MAHFFFTQDDNIELIVKDGEPMGGAVIATHAWMQALHELGQEIILFRRLEDQRPILKEFDWVQECKVFNSKKGIPVIRWVYYRFPSIFSNLKKIRPDFLIESIPTWNSPIIGIFCKLIGTKQVLRLASDKMVDDIINKTYKEFENSFVFWGFQFCDVIMAQNDYQYLKLKNKFPNKKILKISNPFKINKEYLIYKPQPLGYIAWVGNFRYPKNLKLLYKLAKLISGEKFYIAGQSLNKMDEETEEYLGKLKQLKNVVFVGTVSRELILPFFKKAKFLLNTSRYEGFSNTFLEAMCTGTPILTTENVNPDHIIDKNDLGYIYKDPEDLQKFLNSIHPDFYEKKSKNCVSYIQENHDHLILGRKLLEFLNKPSI